MNTPNFLTVLRVLLAFLTAVLLCAPFRFAATAAFIVYCAAGATDWFDGYLARRRNIVTTFGKFMDALSDKIMVSTAFLTLFALGMFGGQTGIALFCAVISMSREFFVSGIRMLAASKGIVLAAERMGKYKAGFQLYSLGAVICAKALDADFSAGDSLLRETVFFSAIATLALSTILSVWSGAAYGARYSHLLKE